MAYKRVDIDEDVKIDGYSFVDKDDCTYAVNVGNVEDGTHDVVQLVGNGEWKFDLYTADIPMFIKMLRAAYEHKA